MPRDRFQAAEYQTQLNETAGLLASGLSLAEAAAFAGIPEPPIDAVLRRRPPFIPTPEQIAAACLEIQAGWTDDDFKDRECGHPGSWRPPSVEARAIARDAA